MNKRQQAFYSSLKVSPQHKKAKARKRQHRKQNYSQIKGSPTYKCMIERKNDAKKRGLKRSSFDRHISNFKVQIRSGSFFYLCCM